MIEKLTTAAGESVYVKKNTIFKGYRVVHPIKNDDGSINWLHLTIGSWANLTKVIIIFALLIFMMFSYNHDMKACVDFMKEYQNRSIISTLPDGSSIFPRWSINLSDVNVSSR